MISYVIYWKLTTTWNVSNSCSLHIWRWCTRPLAWSPQVSKQLKFAATLTFSLVVSFLFVCLFRGLFVISCSTLSDFIFLFAWTVAMWSFLLQPIWFGNWECALISSYCWLARGPRCWMASVEHALSAGERSRVPAVSHRTRLDRGNTLSQLKKGFHTNTHAGTPPPPLRSSPFSTSITSDMSAHVWTLTFWRPFVVLSLKCDNFFFYIFSFLFRLM